jgi:hypothetical protein
MKPRAIATLCLALASVVPAAQAEMYKCNGPYGRPVFTDQPCDNLLPVPEKKEAAEPDKAAKGPSAEDQTRLKALDAITDDPKANDEQKTAAQLEAGNIRRNLEDKLSKSDKERRAALTRKLADPDRQKRAAALRELRTLYRD